MGTKDMLTLLAKNTYYATVEDNTLTIKLAVLDRYSGGVWMEISTPYRGAYRYYRKNGF